MFYQNSREGEILKLLKMPGGGLQNMMGGIEPMQVEEFNQFAFE